MIYGKSFLRETGLYKKKYQLKSVNRVQTKKTLLIKIAPTKNSFRKTWLNVYT